MKLINLNLEKSIYIKNSSSKFAFLNQFKLKIMDKKQVEAREQIKIMLAKKDYYDVLGILKTSNQSEIKKAYKKLALKFHPDKNCLEGSKQVFKKVSNAYTVLINPEQKERYDRYGPEEEQQRHRSSGHAHAHRYTDDEQFDEFEQIYRAFFGMSGGELNRGRGRTTFRFNMGGAGPNSYAQGQRNQGFGLHYLFILLFFIYAIAPLFKSAPYYSLNADATYHYKKYSDILNTQYFVRSEFFDEIKKDSSFKRNIDLEADMQYLLKLRKDCEQAERMKKAYQFRAYQYNGQYRAYYLGQAQKVNLGSCGKINKLYSSNPDYVSQLYYR